MHIMEKKLILSRGLAKKKRKRKKKDNLKYLKK